MTIRGMIRRLERMEKKLGPRARVCLDLREIREGFPLNDLEYSHWELNCMSKEEIRFEVEGSFERADGTERLRRVVVLS